MKKIGIITFWWSQDNYGQLLQAYALQHYLIMQGYEAFIIKFQGKKTGFKEKSIMEKLSPSNICSFIYKKINAGKIAKSNKRNFDSFRDKNLVFGSHEYLSETELINNAPKADVYICGSDQIWNDDFGRSLEPYLLSFGDKDTKRIAYAASFGKKDFSDETMNIFKQWLPKFDHIGVREETGIDVCNRANCTDVKWVPDPTLLLKQEGWKEIINQSQSASRITSHLFLYTLGNSKIADKSKFMSHLKGCKQELVHVSSNSDISGDAFLSIEDWLGSLSTAEFVLTNSFHGMIFSFIFKRNFVILPNTGKHKGMNDRVLSFLRKCSLEDHLMYNYNEQKLNELMTKKVNWEDAHKRIDDWRNEATLFIDNIMDED